MTRPPIHDIESADLSEVSASAKRILPSGLPGKHVWIGADAATLPEDTTHEYNLAHTIFRHLVVQAPLKHKSGHPGGPLSAFTFAYFLSKRRDPSVDQPLRMSPGHLSLLSYGLQYLFGREGDNEHLSSIDNIIDSFRTVSGLPGHIEAGLGDIPFGTGPLGKGVSHGLGTAFGLKYLKKPGIVDVLLADGDSQEGQVAEAFRLASHLKLDNLIVHGDFNDVQLSCQTTEVAAADFSAIARASGWNIVEVANGNDPAQVLAAQEAADALVGKGKPIFVCYYTTMGHGIDFMEEASNTGGKNYHGAPLSEEEAEKATAQLTPLADALSEYEPFRQVEKNRYESADRVQTDFSIDFSVKNLDTYTRTIMEEKGAARKEFGALHIKNLMAADSRIVVLHADLAGSGGFTKAEAEFPDRVINVGVAEANMVMMAAGMRQAGLLPVTYTFAAFSTNEARASARLIDINCGHTRCGVLNNSTHVGLSVGEDGETHQERHYLNIPFDNTQVWMSADSNQAAAMAERALELIAEGKQSVFTFFPRDGHQQIKTEDGELFYRANYMFDGTIDMLRGHGDTKDDVTIIASGITIHSALAAADTLKAEGTSVRVLNVSCVRPIDSAAIIKAALETQHLVTAEDHHTEGGLGGIVSQIIADFSLPCSLRKVGVTNYFPSAPAKELYFIAGLDSETLADTLLDEAKTEVCAGEDALVSCLHQLSHNLKRSQYEKQALPYLSLLTEDGYIESLRSMYREKACNPDDLPKTIDLLKSISL